jgi:hypothetical protein
MLDFRGRQALHRALRGHSCLAPALSTPHQPQRRRAVVQRRSPSIPVFGDTRYSSPAHVQMPLRRRHHCPRSRTAARPGAVRCPWSARRDKARGTRPPPHPMRDLAKRLLIRCRGNARRSANSSIHPGSAVREAPPCSLRVRCTRAERRISPAEPRGRLRRSTAGPAVAERRSVGRAQAIV